MAPTGLDCHRCGKAKNLSSRAGLFSQQRSSMCRSQRQPIRVSKKPRATAEGAADQEHMEQQHLFCTSSKRFDSTSQLVSFIHSCNDGKGLSKQDTQALLDLLFYPQFDPEALMMKSAEEMVHVRQSQRRCADPMKMRRRSST